MREIEKGNFQIGVARSSPEVEALRDAWSKWPGHRDSDIDFYLMILQSYPEVLRPHVITLYRDGKPEAILIGRLEEKKFPFRLGYLTLFHPKVRCLDFVYDGLRGNASAQNAEMLVREVINSLRAGEADLAFLEFLPIDSHLFRFSLELPGLMTRDSFPPRTGHESLKLSSSIEEIYKQMSSKRRSEIRRKAKKFVAQMGDLKTICYRDLSQFDRLFRDVEQIAKKTYLRGLGTGFQDNPLVRARLELGARKGWLRAYVLYSGDRPCAYWIGMHCGNTFHGEYVGYDPEFRLLSPGIFLMMSVIETFCKNTGADRVREIDFGLGSAEYKAALCNSSWLESAVFIFAPRLKGIRLKLIRTFTCLADEFVRKIMARANLLPQVKRLWRDRVSKGADNSVADSGHSDRESPVSAAS